MRVFETPLGLSGLGLFGWVFASLVAVAVFRRRPSAGDEIAPESGALVLLVTFAAIGRGDGDQALSTAGHPRVALEDGAFVNNERRCVDIGVNARGRAQHDRVAGIDVAGDVALDLD